jgi:phage terminase large subunit-like protein
MTIDPEAFKRWTPAAQEKALAALRAAQNDTWRPFYCPNMTCNGQPHDTWEWNHGRADQRPPTGTDWLVWLMKSGRGSGKTRTGTEITHRIVEKVPRISLIGPTAPDIRDIMLEGESGILRVYPPGRKPVYEPSKRRVTFHNGATATLFSGEEPDRLRGPESYWAWVDEGAHIAQIQACWDNLMFGLRLGRRPWVLVTTTPKPRPWLKTLIKAPSTRISVASTYDNLANLSSVYRDIIIPKYEGTRLGRQELNAEVLEDVEGALWTWDLIERARVSEPPELDRIVVGVDPAGSKKKSADETGIVVVGAAGEHLYVLADLSGHYSPAGWATAANQAYERYAADAIVVERNFGGDMVAHTLRSSGYSGARVLNRQTRRGKALRAEPVVGRYEKDDGYVHHVGNHFTDLETQMTEWQPYEDGDSPDRVDALVYAATELMRGAGAAAVSSPADLRRGDNGRLRIVRDAG